MKCKVNLLIQREPEIIEGLSFNKPMPVGVNTWYIRKEKKIQYETLIPLTRYLNFIADISRPQLN